MKKKLIILISVRGLAAGDFDIIIGDLTIVPSRLQLIEFSVPFQTSDVIIIKKQATALDSNIFAVARPLAGEVWLAILASVILGWGHVNIIISCVLNEYYTDRIRMYWRTFKP